MEVKKIIQDVTMSFKLNGFTIRKDAASFLCDQFQTLSREDRTKWVDKLISHIQNQCLAQPVVEKETVQLALKECKSTGCSETESILNVINVFNIPKFQYVPERKKFVKDDVRSFKVDLYPTPKWKAQYLVDRYTTIYQRTVRNKLFAPETLPGARQEKLFNLKMVECLLSCSSRMDEVIVLGLLTQLTEGTYYLEDPTGSVSLDLSQTRFHSGLFTEHCFVLAEGFYEDKVLHVMGFVMPPSEPRATSQVYFGNVNTFGGPSKTLLKNSDNLINIERDNEDAMIVFLSDVWLDNLKVMTKLRSLFNGYNDFPPAAIVLMGDFLSCPYGFEQAEQMRTAFKSLGEVISQFPQLMQVCIFILVPSSSDPGGPNILPRPPLPEYVTQDIKGKLGDQVIVTSNPCRIQYCTQEIVVLRHNLVTKMCRNSVHFPESGDIPDHVTKTLLSQCTLTPLPLGVQPVYWNHADALSLYPVPDLVVIADHFQPFTRTNQNCTFINPGSFPRTEYSFKVYMPASRTVEDSQLPKED